MRALPRLSLDGAVAGAVALTVFSFAAGSSSLDGVRDAFQRLRWGALLLLLGVAVLALVRSPRRPPPAAYVPAASLVILALASAAWSVAPQTTLARAGTFTVLLVAAGALGMAAASRPDLALAALWGIVAAGAAVLVASVLVGIADPPTARLPATESSRARFQGFTENPNALGLLSALVLPVALALAARRDGSRRTRVAAAVTAAGLIAAVAAADSRGAYAAAAAGVVVVGLALPGPVTRRGVVTGAALAALVLGFGLGSIPDPTERFAGPERVVPDAELKRLYAPLACVELPFDDIGHPPCGETTATVPTRAASSSGRLDAWSGALDRAAERPALGFGFGNEARAFSERYSYFEAYYVENSYLGLVLQLGAVGAALLMVLAVAVGESAVRVRRLGDAIRVSAAGCCGAVAAGGVLALSQSYVFSVGNLGTTTFWIAVFLLIGLSAAVPSVAS